MYFEYLGSCKKKLQKLQKLALVVTKELIQRYPVWPINANNIGNHFCLQRLVSVIKFIAK